MKKPTKVAITHPEAIQWEDQVRKELKELAWRWLCFTKYGGSVEESNKNLRFAQRLCGMFPSSQRYFQAKERYFGDTDEEVDAEVRITRNQDARPRI